MAGKGKLRERRYEVEPEVTFKMKINEQSGPIDATRASTRPGARIAAFAPRGGGDGRGAAIIIVNDGRSISLVETLEIGSGTDGMALFLAFSAKHAATQSLIVTPHESTVARVTEVPAGELAEMVGAAELLAEAGLPSSVASWRRGGGLVGGRTRVGMRQVLLTGWITRPGEVDKYVASGGHGGRASAKAARSLSAPSTFCTPMAALAMLMGESAAGAYVDGAGHAYVGDAADAGVGGSGGSGGSGRGAGVLVLSGEKSVSRVLLGDDEESPLVGAARALSVAAHAAGLTDDDLPAVDGAMCLTVRAQQELCSRVGGLPSSGEGRELREWLNRFGLALGAALTRCVRGGEGLSNLRFAAVPVVASAPVRAAVWVSGGRRAAGDSKLLGIGVSSYVEITAPLGLFSEYGKVTVDDDGGATMVVGTSAHGQGHDTAFSMIVSDLLGIPMDMVRHVQSDTDLVPRGAGTMGSRSLQTAGSAVFVASGNVLEQGRKLAARMLEAAESDIVKGGGGLQVVGVPAKVVSWVDLAAEAKKDGGQLQHELDFSEGDSTFPFGTHVSVVEIDQETGAIELLRHVAVDDCGRILNPMMVTGQQHGGIAQGIAQVLFEHVQYDEDGNPRSANLLDYLMPSAAEMVNFETSNTETDSPRNPLGAKGIGESGTIGSTPALHNAVVDALSHLGVSHVDMPCTPEKVWAAINAA